MKQYTLAFPQAAGPAGKERNWPIARSMFSELRRLGYIDGQNLIIKDFTAEGHAELYADLARQVVERNPDVIVVIGLELLPALLSATRTIPVVAVIGSVLDVGFEASLSHPSGNLTGVNVYGVETNGKLLEILKEAVSSTGRVAVLSTEATAGYDVYRAKLREYAGELGISLIAPLLHDGSPQEIERGIAELVQQHADALLISPEVAFVEQAPLIVHLAEEHRLPTMYPSRFWIEAGGLMTYTWDAAEVGRQLADDVHRALQGAKPGDIPIYQSTRFKLMLNLNAAKAIGFTFPPGILARADEVIE